jgi:hypothetical protein
VAVSVQKILESLEVNCAAVNAQVGEFDTWESGECLANTLRHKTFSEGSVPQSDVGDVDCVFQDRLYIAVGRKVDASIRPRPVLKQPVLKRPFLIAEGRERHMLRTDADKLLLQVTRSAPL